MSSDIASPRPTWVRYRILAWLCVVAIIANAQRSVMAVAGRPLADELRLVDRDLGDIKSAFFLGYALFQIPSGLLRDYFGTRATLTAFATLWSLCVAAMAVARSYDSLYLTWLLAGVAQAGVFPCAVSAIRQWFPGHERAIASGWLSSCMSIGSAVSTGLAASLLGQGTGWQGLFVLFAIPGLAWAIGFGMMFRSRPDDHPRVNELELAEISRGNDAREQGSDLVHERTPWGTILGSLTLWLLFAQQCCRAACYVFFQTWFPEYLQQTRQISLEAAGWLSSLPLLAVVLGAPLGGTLSDRITGRYQSPWWGRQGLAAVMLTFCALLTLIASTISDVTTAVLTISLGMFCFAIGGPSAYATAINLGGRHTSTVFSMMNMFGNVGGFLLPLLLPRFVEATSWDAALTLFAAIYLFGAFCWLVMGSRSPFQTNSAP